MRIYLNKVVGVVILTPRINDDVYLCAREELLRMIGEHHQCNVLHPLVFYRPVEQPHLFEHVVRLGILFQLVNGTCVLFRMLQSAMTEQTGLMWSILYGLL